MNTHKQIPTARLTQKTVELPQPQFINKVVDVRVCGDKSLSPSGEEKKQSRCLRSDSETKW